MASNQPVHTGHQSGDRPLRVLVAVNGHEPADWTDRACRFVSQWKDAGVCVLGIVEDSAPPFTSLIPAARHVYVAARSAWRDDEEQRVRGALDRVRRTLTRRVEVVCRASSPRGYGDTIVDHALSWGADVIVVAAPPRMSRSWLCHGPVHQRLLRHGMSAVLAIPAAAEPRPAGRIIRLRALPSGMRPAAGRRI
jgi:nucleotide-binding universal stress UspA family protein